jgi:hypothetical protein
VIKSLIISSKINILLQLLLITRYLFSGWFGYVKQNLYRISSVFKKIDYYSRVSFIFKIMLLQVNVIDYTLVYIFYHNFINYL